MKLPTLYQKTATGAIQQWTISTEIDGASAIITVVFGQVDGKLQTTSDIIKTGKNSGRANATTAHEQADAEAKAKWQKQKKKGYVDSIQAATAGEVDTGIILGGIEPMLAPNKSYPKDSDLVKRISFPCWAQPKLDGMRCLAVIKDGVASLWSRTRKQILSVPHIVAALEEMFPKGSYIYDGELYRHDYRNSFEDLISIIRKDEPDAEGLYKVVQYHVYDCVKFNDICGEATKFNERMSFCDFDEMFDTIPDCIVPVTTKLCVDLERLVEFYETCVDEEFEGSMARNLEGLYASGKRSVDLQKMKPFMDAEFPIIAANEGRGKDAGTVATFTCTTPEGKEFRARLKASYDHRRKLFNNPEMWRGKQLTVTLKRMTNGGVPYIPVAKSLRDYE